MHLRTYGWIGTTEWWARGFRPVLLFPLYAVFNDLKSGRLF